MDFFSFLEYSSSFCLVKVDKNHNDFFSLSSSFLVSSHRILSKRGQLSPPDSRHSVPSEAINHLMHLAKPWMTWMYYATPKLLFMTLWLFVWSWSNFYVILFGVPKITVWSFRDRCPELFEMQADKKCLSIYSLFVCFGDAMVTLCDVIAVFHLFDINVKLTSSIRAA